MLLGLIAEQMLTDNKAAPLKSVLRLAILKYLI